MPTIFGWLESSATSPVGKSRVLIRSGRLVDEDGDRRRIRHRPVVLPQGLRAHGPLVVCRRLDQDGVGAHVGHAPRQPYGGPGGFQPSPHGQENSGRQDGAGSPHEGDPLAFVQEDGLPRGPRDDHAFDRMLHPLAEVRLHRLQVHLARGRQEWGHNRNEDAAEIDHWAVRVAVGYSESVVGVRALAIQLLSASRTCSSSRRPVRLDPSPPCPFLSCWIRRRSA